jgi:hypothetical protein
MEGQYNGFNSMLDERTRAFENDKESIISSINSTKIQIVEDINILTKDW